MSLFISMYVRKEALLSSQIEGTQATLEDVLDPLVEQNANQNVSDVINYIKATEFALNRLETLPLCNRLIKDPCCFDGGSQRPGKESGRIPDLSELDRSCRKHAEKCEIYSAAPRRHAKSNVGFGKVHPFG